MTSDAHPEPDLETPSPLALHVPFWDRLYEEERRALAAAARSEWHPAGTLICAEGSHGDTLYIVESGRVAVLKDVGESEPVILGTRGPGEILGEMSLIGEMTRTASLAVVEEGRLLHITAADFVALMNTHRGISWAVLNVLNDRLQESDIARIVTAREGEVLANTITQLTGETRRLVELAHTRQETVELLVHDLRTPIAVVQGCIDILADAFAGQEREIFDMAQRNNQRVLTMLDQLLDVARIDTVEPETTCDSIDLAQLLSEVVADIRTSATQAGIDLALDPIPPLPPLLAGATALRRVLDNLLNNAISYTPRGGRVTVSAALHPDAGPRGAVAVSVTDTGPGVPPEHRERIFERFVRLSDTRPGHRGFGLGLYYCRQAVQAHGGRIWVEPGPGNRGSRFTFLIPIEGTPHA